MTTNAFAISRRLIDRGVDETTAKAVAEEIVTHADDSAAKKEDIARVETKVNIHMGISVLLLIAFLSDKIG